MGRDWEREAWEHFWAGGKEERVGLVGKAHPRPSRVFTHFWGYLGAKIFLAIDFGTFGKVAMRCLHISLGQKPPHRFWKPPGKKDTEDRVGIITTSQKQ